MRVGLVARTGMVLAIAVLGGALVARALGEAPPGRQLEQTPRRDPEVRGASPRPTRPSIYFVDATRAAGAATRPSRTWGAAWVDHDRDRFPELVVVRHWFKPMFLSNSGGRYLRPRVPELQRSGVDRHACVWGEADGDARPDLYCLQGADKGTGAGPNQLLLQRGDDLRERAKRFGIDDPLGRGRSANWLDHDGDGDLDLFVGNHRRKVTTNLVFRNDRGSFRAVDVGASERLATVASAWADWDRDGDPDLLVLQHAPDRAVAYRNDDGSFVRTSIPGVTDEHWQSAAFADYDGDGWTDLHLVRLDRAAVMTNDRGRFKTASESRLREGRMSAWLDVDNDGDLDLVVVQGAEGRKGDPYRPSRRSVNHPDLLLVNRAGRFVRVVRPFLRGPRRGNGDAVAVADHDRDGRVDVFVTNGYYHWRGPTTLLENRSRAGNWVGLELHGPRWNPLGFGARIAVRAGGLRYRREQNDGFAFRSQSEVGYLHVGIADASRARARIRWPDGTRDCVVVPAGQIEPVVIGRSPCGRFRGQR